MTLLTSPTRLQLGHVVRHDPTGLAWLVVDFCCSKHPVTLARPGIEASVNASELTAIKHPRRWKDRPRGRHNA